MNGGFRHVQIGANLIESPVRQNKKFYTTIQSEKGKEKTELIS
jgi:hypothetical protein